MITKLHQGAHDDLVSAQRFYNSREPGLGARFRQTIDSAVKQFLRMPTASPLWPRIDPKRGVHRYVVKRWPFAIAYMLHENRLSLSRSHTTDVRPATGLSECTSQRDHYSTKLPIVVQLNFEGGGPSTDLHSGFAETASNL